MTTKHKNDKLVVLGIFRDTYHAETAVDQLRSAGFRSDDISALFPAGDDTKQFAHEKGTKAPEGATTGGLTGGVIGGTLGLLAGIGSLAIPGAGPFIAAGPIMAALAGVGAGGTVGALAGALIGLGIPEYEAKRYEGRIKDGGVLVSVHCDNSEWEEKAESIFESVGASDISSTTESSADYKVEGKSVGNF